MRLKPYTNPNKLLLDYGYEKNGARGYTKVISRKKYPNDDRYHCLVELDGWIDLHIDIKHTDKIVNNRETKKFSPACVKEINRLKRFDYSYLPLNKLIWIRIKEILHL